MPARTYNAEELTQALQAAHYAVCDSLGLNPETDSSPVAYNGPCGLEPWHAAPWTQAVIDHMSPAGTLTPGMPLFNT